MQIRLILQLNDQVNHVVVKGKPFRTSTVKYKRFTNPLCTATDHQLQMKRIQTDLGELESFHTEVNRKHDSFQHIMADPLSTLNVAEFNKWIRKYKRNILLDAPFLHDEEEDEKP